MIKRFLSKYILEVIPSIVATVVGAYIVTHYINVKPGPDKPAAAASASANPAKAVAADKADEADKAAEAAPDKAAPAKPEPKSQTAKSEPTKPAVKAAARASEKIADKAEKSEAASLLRRPHPAAKEQDKDRTAAKAAEPAVERSEANAAAQDRDANELARDALARLRGTSEQPKPADAETLRARDASRLQADRSAVKVVYAPPGNTGPAPVARQDAATAIPPLAEPVTITPSPQIPSVSDEPIALLDDPSRPTPPADIPAAFGSRASAPASVADEMMSAAKSVLQAVVPH